MQSFDKDMNYLEESIKRHMKSVGYIDYTNDQCNFLVTEIAKITIPEQENYRQLLFKMSINYLKENYRISGRVNNGIFTGCFHKDIDSYLNWEAEQKK